MAGVIHRCSLSGSLDGFMEVWADTSGNTLAEASGAAQAVLDLIGHGKERLIRHAPAAEERHDFEENRTTYHGRVRFAFRNVDGVDVLRPQGPGGPRVMYALGKGE